jgi:hypothetical protein
MKAWEHDEKPQAQARMLKMQEELAEKTRGIRRRGGGMIKVVANRRSQVVCHPHRKSGQPGGCGDAPGPHPGRVNDA